MVAGFEWLQDVNHVRTPGEAALAPVPEAPGPAARVAGHNRLLRGFDGTPVEFVDGPRASRPRLERPYNLRRSVTPHSRGGANVASATPKLVRPLKPLIM